MVGSSEPLKNPENKTMLILASLALTFWLPVIALVIKGKDDPQIKFMAIQSIIWCLIGYLLCWVLYIPWLIAAVMTLLGLLKALKGEVWESPVIGGMVKSKILKQ